MLVVISAFAANGGHNAARIANAVRAADSMNECVVFAEKGGKAEHELKRLKVNYSIVASPDEVITWVNRRDADAFVATMDPPTGGMGRFLIPKMRNLGLLTVSVMDFPGARIMDFKEHQPHLVCVGSDADKTAIEAQWGKSGPDTYTVSVTGYPHLDEVANMTGEKKLEAAASCQKKLKLPSFMNVVYYAAQLKHSGATMREIVNALRIVNQPCILIARPHYLMQHDEKGVWKDEVAIWQEAQANWPNVVCPKDEDGVTMREIITASIAVVGQYPTDAMHAASMRVPVFLREHPDTIENLGAELKNPNLDHNVFVEDGAGYGYSTEKELAHLFRQVFDGEKKVFTDEQTRNYRADGMNAERVVGAIQQALEKRKLSASA